MCHVQICWFWLDQASLCFQITHTLRCFKQLEFNPNALRMAKTQWSFGHSECNRVKKMKHYSLSIYKFQSSSEMKWQMFSPCRCSVLKWLQVNEAWNRMHPKGGYILFKSPLKSTSFTKVEVKIRKLFR